MIEVELAMIQIVETQEGQIIILREKGGTRYFPILIGIYEALAIDRRVKKLVPQRPLTHDLLGNVIKELSGTLERIYINDLRDNTFFAKLIISQDGKTIEVDSRPSDAIALAVRMKVPMYVEDTVMDRAAIEPEEAIADETKLEEVKAHPEVVDDAPEGEGDLSAFEDFLGTLDLDDLEDNE